MSLLFPQASLFARATYQVANPPFSNLNLRLYTNNLVPGPGTLLSDIVQCSQVGYTAGGPLYSYPGIDADGDPVAINDDLLEVVVTDIAAPQTIFGFYLDDNGSTYLLGAFRLDSSIELDELLTTFVFSFAIGLTCSSVKQSQRNTQYNGAAFEDIGWIVLGGTATVDHS